MEAIFLKIGEIFCLIGGILIALFVLGLIAYFVCAAWVFASNRFRDICKAESLIFEYRKHRKEFLQWMYERERKRVDGAK